MAFIMFRIKKILVAISGSNNDASCFMLLLINELNINGLVVMRKL